MINSTYMNMFEAKSNIEQKSCQCKISLPTQVYMLVYEYLGYRR